jgi:hypothetical protein
MEETITQSQPDLDFLDFLDLLEPIARFEWGEARADYFSIIQEATS